MTLKCCPLLLLLIGLGISSIACNNIRISANQKTTQSFVTAIALGQPDFSTGAAPGGVAADSLGQFEYKLHSDGTRFFLGDYTNSRVLIWNQMPTSFQQPADVVVGQPDMTSNTCNNGGLSASSLCNPGGAYSNGTKLFVVDYNNNRILIWNTIPTSDFAPADVVLGQVNMTTGDPNSGGLSSISMFHPWHLIVNGNMLLVSDYGNNRILIWNTIPTVNRTPANVVVGQANMGTNIDGSASPTAETLSYPYELATDGVKLVVADTSSERILIYNTIPTSNGASADVVLGQVDMTSGVYGGPVTSQTITPSSIILKNGKIFSLDGRGKRLLIWNSIPILDNTPADVVFGQPDMVSDTPDNGGISATSLGSWPEGLAIDNTRIFIGDPANRRVLVLPNIY